MSDPTGLRRRHVGQDGWFTEIGHRITDFCGDIRRDGRAVKIERISDSEIRIGCTTIEIVALQRLMQLIQISEKKVLQEGME